MADVGRDSILGLVGRVTVSIPARGPGEVLLQVRGGSEAFAAWADEEIPRHSRVIVVDVLSARSVFVTPHGGPVTLPHPPDGETMFFWHVPAPNEALLISGSKRRKGEAEFRIVTGHGAFVVPVRQKARMLSLELRETVIEEECITQQGIRLNVRAVAAFKVGDDEISIANAARRFLSEQDRMEVLVGRVFSGHLRSIVGGLTVEQLIRERDEVAQEIKDGSHSEMEKLGIVVDALEIQEIDDETGYINNLAAPHEAAIASKARIAKAEADQEAAERELKAQAMKSQYQRDLIIRQAGYKAESEQARARADQAGPLTEAEASREVIEAQTQLAVRKAELAAQRLEAEVRRPADAEAYRQRTLAEAARDQARFAAEADAYRRRVTAEAEADAERTVARAQADANQARGESLRGGNQELIAANRLVELLPTLVQNAAKGLADSQLTVLNGTEGVNELIAGLVGQGMAIMDSLRHATAVTGSPIASGNSTGSADSNGSNSNGAARRGSADREDFNLEA